MASVVTKVADVLLRQINSPEKGSENKCLSKVGVAEPCRGEKVDQAAWVEVLSDQNTDGWDCADWPTMYDMETDNATKVDVMEQDDGMCCGGTEMSDLKAATNEPIRVSKSCFATLLKPSCALEATPDVKARDGFQLVNKSRPSYCYHSSEATGDLNDILGATGLRKDTGLHHFESSEITPVDVTNPNQADLSNMKSSTNGVTPKQTSMEKDGQNSTADSLESKQSRYGLFFVTEIESSSNVEIVSGHLTLPKSKELVNDLKGGKNCMAIKIPYNGRVGKVILAQLLSLDEFNREKWKFVRDFMILDNERASNGNHSHGDGHLDDFQPFEDWQGETDVERMNGKGFFGAEAADEDDKVSRNKPTENAEVPSSGGPSHCEMDTQDYVNGEFTTFAEAIRLAHDKIMNSRPMKKSSAGGATGGGFEHTGNTTVPGVEMPVELLERNEKYKVKNIEDHYLKSVAPSTSIGQLEKARQIRSARHAYQRTDIPTDISKNDAKSQRYESKVLARGRHGSNSGRVGKANLQFIAPLSECDPDISSMTNEKLNDICKSEMSPVSAKAKRKDVLQHAFPIANIQEARRVRTGKKTKPMMRMTSDHKTSRIGSTNMATSRLRADRSVYRLDLNKVEEFITHFSDVLITSIGGATIGIGILIMRSDIGVVSAMFFLIMALFCMLSAFTYSGIMFICRQMAKH